MRCHQPISRTLHRPICWSRGQNPRPYRSGNRTRRKRMQMQRGGRRRGSHQSLENSLKRSKYDQISQQRDQQIPRFGRFVFVWEGEWKEDQEKGKKNELFLISRNQQPTTLKSSPLSSAAPFYLAVPLAWNQKASREDEPVNGVQGCVFIVKTKENEWDIYFMESLACVSTRKLNCIKN